MNGFPVLFGVFAVFLALWKLSFVPSKSLRLHRTETWLCYGVTAAGYCSAGRRAMFARTGANSPSTWLLRSRRLPRPRHCLRSWALVCATMSTGTLLLLWSLLAGLADAAEAITVERDSGAGMRAGGFLAGSGAVCGAAVAGDWVSLEATLRDFARFIWPLLAVAILVTLCERTLNRRALARRLSTKTSASLAAGLAMLGFAYAVWVAKQ